MRTPSPLVLPTLPTLSAPFAPARGAAEAEAVRVRVAVYCRYSSHEQDEGYSIEAQHARVEREALAHPEWSVRYYDEPARSAYREEPASRPVFAALLDDVRAGAVDLVVVHKLDRWSRRLRLTLETLEMLRGRGVGFLSLEERFDLTTPFGWMSLHMFGALAQFYSANLSQETLKGKVERARHGLHNAHVPFGYRRGASAKDPFVPDRRGAGDVDELGRPLGDWEGLQTLFRLLLSGHSNQEAADALNADGRWHLTVAARHKQGGAARPFQRSSVQQIRANVWYRPYAPGDERGTVEFMGEHYRGTHEAALSWDDWHALQALSRGRRRGWAKHWPHPVGAHPAPAWVEQVAARNMSDPVRAEFRGLVACASCGGALYVYRARVPLSSGAGSRGGNVREYTRYVCEARARGVACPDAGKWVRAQDLRLLWAEWLETHVHLGRDWEERVRVEAIRLARAGSQQGSQEARAVWRAREQWTRRREAAVRLYYEGEIARGVYEARVRECDARLAELTAAGRGEAQHAARLVDAGALLTQLGPLWRAAAADLAEETPAQAPGAEPVGEPGPASASRAALILELQRLAGLVLAPHGLRVQLVGYRGLYHRHQRPEARPRSGTLATVQLAAPFAELLALFADPTTDPNTPPS